MNMNSTVKVLKSDRGFYLANVKTDHSLTLRTERLTNYMTKENAEEMFFNYENMALFSCEECGNSFFEIDFACIHGCSKTFTLLSDYLLPF